MPYQVARRRRFRRSIESVARGRLPSLPSREKEKERESRDTGGSRRSRDANHRPPPLYASLSRRISTISTRRFNFVGFVCPGLLKFQSPILHPRVHLLHRTSRTFALRNQRDIRYTPRAESMSFVFARHVRYETGNKPREAST